MHFKLVVFGIVLTIFQLVLAFIDNPRSTEHQPISIGKSIENLYELELCDTLYCNKGEECIVKNNVAMCHCRRSCPHKNKPVCATNGRTYSSYCHLHAEACWTNTRLKVVRSGSCEKVLKKEFWRDEQIIPITDVTKSIKSSTKENYNCEDLPLLLSNLLQHFRTKLHDRGKSAADIPLVTNVMFGTFDINNDKVISSEELDAIGKEQTYESSLPHNCGFNDLMLKADSNRNGFIESDEFFLLFGSPVAYLPPEKRVKKHTVAVGKQYQLFCDIENHHPVEKIKWYRNGIPLKSVAPYSFQISTDGSLYLTETSTVHNGNFSCKLGVLPTSLEQTHVVRIIDPPVVDISPSFILLTPGESTWLRCTVGGNAFQIPRIFWDKNEVRIAENVTVLELANVSPKDTGSYKCTAATDLGDTHATASVVVREKYRAPELYYKGDSAKPTYFAAFSSSGIEMYDAQDCALTKVISGSYPVTEMSNGFLCGYPHNCRWSDAVPSKPGSFIYATLYDEKLLLQINMTAGSIDQIFRLNHIPMRVWYVPWEDTVWLESWHDKNGFYRTIQIIRSASEPIRHSLSHALPMQDEFDAVENIFLPTRGNLKYGYITHWQELALHKIDLNNVKIVYRISLAKYDCHPSFVTFVSQNGLIIVSCLQGNSTTLSTGGQIILDYISDAVVSYEKGVVGEPSVSGDGQFVFTVEANQGKVFVQKILERTLSKAKMLDIVLPHLDWVTHADKRLTSWSLYATSPLSDHLLRLSTFDEKIENVMHLKQPIATNRLHLDHARKPILSLSDGRSLLIAYNDSLLNFDTYSSTGVKCRIRRPSGTSFLKLL